MVLAVYGTKVKNEINYHKPLRARQLFIQCRYGGFYKYKNALVCEKEKFGSSACMIKLKNSIRHGTLYQDANTDHWRPISKEMDKFGISTDNEIDIYIYIQN